jgi:nucleoid DNA-binding protein
MATNKNAGGKPLTKSAIYKEVAEHSGLSNKQVAAAFDALSSIIRREVGKKGPGAVTVPPGLIKIVKRTRPATKARQGRNPQTGEPMMIKAKPARTVIRARALKTLQEMIA